MDTVERSTVTAVEQVYDGFISYSHAADDLLAPRLQAGLQRFAKPWWKRRAVRIFRDESSLSANPHLWSSITEALDTSGWFVLLLSPDAARSEWVNQEISYWVENRDPKKILPVVTDGDFSWADGDVAGDAVPDALRGVFAEEPRWVDVRWVKDEDQLDLKNPRFADAVADVASTIRGIPKDDLASEEVRQHRRTIRTAWGAGVALLVFATLAAGASVVAIGQRDRAQAEALMANARAQLESDPELALLLAIESIDVSRPEGSAGHQTLVRGLLQQRTTAHLQPGVRDGPFATHAASADGVYVATWSGHSVTLQRLDAGSEPLWETTFAGKGEIVAGSFSPDRDRLFLLESGWTRSDATGVGRVLVIGVQTGKMERELNVGACPLDMQEVVASPRGETLVLTWGRAHPSGQACIATDAVAGFLDVTSGQVRRVADFEFPLNQSGGPSLSDDRGLLAVGDERSVRVVDVATKAIVKEFQSGGVSTLDHDGERVLVGRSPVELRGVETGELLTVFPVEDAVDASFSEDGRNVLISTGDGMITFFDTSGGAIVELMGHSSGPFKITATAAGVVSESEDGIRQWNDDLALSPRPFGQPFPDAMVDTQGVGQMAITQELIVIPYSTDLAARSYLVLEHDGAVVRNAPEAGQIAAADDDSFVVIEPWRDNEVSPSGGAAGRAEALELVEPRSGQRILRLDSCGYWFDFMNQVVEADSECNEPIVFSDIEISEDGSVVAASGGFWHFGAWSAETGELLYQSSRIEAPFSWPHQIGVSPDGSRLVFLDLVEGGYVMVDVETGASTGPVGSVISANEILVHPNAGVVFVGESSGDVLVIDLDSWQVVSRLSEVGVGPLLDLALSNEGDILAAVGLGGRVLLWEWQTAALREDIDVQVPLAHVGYFPSGDLIIVGAYGEIILIPASVDELVEIARDRVARSFSPSECVTYEITSCVP